MSSPQVVVDGTYVESVTPWGDLEWSTVWPGGSDALTFGVSQHSELFRPGALVELVWSGERLFSGLLADPTRGERLMAEGLYRQGEDFFSIIPDPTAVLLARTRGLSWGVPSTDLWIPAAAAPLDDTVGLSVSRILDHVAGSHGQEWGVLPDGTPVMRPWPAATLYTAPGIEGLGITREGYASRIFALFLRVSDNTFQTVMAEDEDAIARWGIVEHVIREPLAEGAAMTAEQAQALLDGMVARGRYEIGWKTPIEVQHGDVVDAYGAPVSLNKITAGEVLRVQGLVDDVADLAGQTWVDVPMARVEHPNEHTAVISPRSLRSPMADVLTGGSP